MDCRILRQITLTADGHLGCDDSVGYKIDLGHVSSNCHNYWQRGFSLDYWERRT
jgi:hypothetical protein